MQQCSNATNAAMRPSQHYIYTLLTLDRTICSQLRQQSYPYIQDNPNENSSLCSQAWSFRLIPTYQGTTLVSTASRFGSQHKDALGGGLGQSSGLRLTKVRPLPGYGYSQAFPRKLRWLHSTIRLGSSSLISQPDKDINIIYWTLTRVHRRLSRQFCPPLIG